MFKPFRLLTTSLIAGLSLVATTLPSAAQGTVELKKLQFSASSIPDSTEVGLLWAKNIDKADTVLLAVDNTFADALASGVAQGHEQAPLLFIDPQRGLDTDTIAAIQRLGATKAIILGGVHALNESLVSELSKIGVKSSRIQGASRVETSIAIAKHTGAKNSTVMLARAYGDGSQAYADSLAASAFAAKTGFPVILTTPVGSSPIHPEVANYLKEAKIQHVIIVGGTGAIPAQTEGVISKLGVKHVQRIAGATRDETAIELAKEWKSNGAITVVDGFEPEDKGFLNGFAAALSAARANAPVVLSSHDTLNENAFGLIKTPAESGISGFCGTYVPPVVCTQVAQTQNAELTSLRLVPPRKELLSIRPTVLVKTETLAQKPVARDYSVLGLEQSATYTVTLAQAQREGLTWVPQTHRDGTLVTSNDLLVTNINGMDVEPRRGPFVVSSQNGAIRFAVVTGDNPAPGVLVPVVSLHNKTVIVGGPIEIATSESPSHSQVRPSRIISIDSAAKTLTVDYENRGITTSIYYGTAGSTFVVDKTSTFEGHSVDIAEFERRLTVGDSIETPTYWDKAASKPTQFFLNDIVPGTAKLTKQEVLTTRSQAGFTATAVPEAINAELQLEVVITPALDQVYSEHEATYDPASDEITYHTGSSNTKTVKVASHQVLDSVKPVGTRELNGMINGLENSRSYIVFARWINTKEKGAWSQGVRIDTNEKATIGQDGGHHAPTNPDQPANPDKPVTPEHPGDSGNPATPKPEPTGTQLTVSVLGDTNDGFGQTSQLLVTLDKSFNAAFAVYNQTPGLFNPDAFTVELQGGSAGPIKAVKAEAVNDTTIAIANGTTKHIRLTFPSDVLLDQQPDGIYTVIMAKETVTYPDNTQNKTTSAKLRY